MPSTIELRDAIYPILSKSAVFAGSIKFSNLFTDFGAHTITAATTVTVDSLGAIAGSQALLKFVADGSNIPAFAGFKQKPESLPYKNTAGIENTVLFSYDGDSFWYALVSQKIASSDVFNVKHYGAVGDGIADDRPAFLTAIAAMPAGGGTVYVPSGTYKVSMVVPIPANSTLQGDGRASCITCPDGGWTLGTTDRFGIVSIRSASNVRITNICIRGTKTQAQTQTPKLIFFENCLGLKIDHCWFENSAWEGVWGGGNPDNSRQIIISNNHVQNVGWPNSFGGLPALQPNGRDVIVSNNYLEDVGAGIGPSGSGIVVDGNVIKGFKNVGIGLGDGVDSGICIVSNNLISFQSDSALRVGIAVEGGEGAAHPVSVTGNFISLTGIDSDQQAKCYRSTTGGNVSFMGNTAEIIGRGTGFEVLSTPTTKKITLSGNTVEGKSVSAATSYGFLGVAVNAGESLDLRSASNSCKGMPATSYAYDYRAVDGILVAGVLGDWADGGLIRVGGIQRLANKQSMFLANVAGAGGEFFQKPTISALVIEPKIGGSNYRISAETVNISGSVAGLDRQRTSVCIDTATNSTPAENLRTISGGVDGMFLLLSQFDPNRTITIKSGGNIKVPADIAMSEFRRLLLILDSGFWYVVN